MAATTRTPRERWVEEGLRALAAGGPDAVRVDVLAKDLGVTRGGFYWQFGNRKALLEALLDAWERTSVDEVIERIEAGGGDARTKLRALFAVAASRRMVLRVDLAVRDWARRDAAVAARLRRVDNRRMEYMRGLFGAFVADPDEVEARCTITFAIFVGHHFMRVDHAGRTRRGVLDLVLERLLE
ncbi:MAG TPA: TetR/AcrR family transcriptional regulator [Solirubrobacterales bacterium]|nr:TetR/AcrR family transcriptional regulator [Solirubrobacterales bacterium]